MDYSGMPTPDLLAAVEAMQAEVARREAEGAARAAVDNAVAAYADLLGITTLQAWRELTPEGADPEDDTEPGPPPTAPEYEPPTGAHDAYNSGDLVTFKGKVYRARLNAVTWSPAAYPQAWEAIG